jgi:transcriptional repressor NrdR
MRCPYCFNEETKVTDSRNVVETNAIKRRRECLSCQKRFTTFETVDLVIQVKKRDGSFEEFSQQKITQGLDAACRHTKVSHSGVRELAHEITMELLERQVKEISTEEIGSLIMKRLIELDHIAYIRFACVYKRFKDFHQLQEAIDSINSEKAQA